MTDYMINGLVKRRAELAGQIAATHETLSQLVKDLGAIDDALRVVAPDMEVEAIRPKMFRPPEDWANRGQMSRLVLSILRQSREPLTTREIAAQMMLERALDAEDTKLLGLMTKRVGAALRVQRDKGRAEAMDGPGNYLLWRVVSGI
ncbi:hypothetical protein FGU71_03050 [Erythrobacter insulae]|uniref:Uncharacterized protein n=1 Tax=Erythrobacter insulae TaxID=2584124 RepID=A0A547P9W4_9SPHN|nr:hypothetical protein [Erythrobacter insulae]TRD10935.1 hypothetical protein FGU71_03050 [Erythrobacter insulae]